MSPNTVAPSLARDCKLEYVDAIRGIAILLVIMVHSSQNFGVQGLPALCRDVIAQGGRGVQLFFMASAFTLFLSFKNRASGEKHPTRNFFIRRFFRIAPMYYCGIIYYHFLDANGPHSWLGNATHISTGNVLANFFFVHGVYPEWITSLVPGGWSITVEMSFYLILPWLYRWIRSLQSAIWFTLGAFLSSVLLNDLLTRYAIYDHASLWEAYLFLYFPSQLPVFGFGIIAYFVVIEREMAIGGRALLSMGVLFFFQVLWTPIDRRIFVAIAFVFLVVGLARHPTKALVNRAMCYVGRVSYSAYLVHFAVLFWLTRFGITDLVREILPQVPLVTFGIYTSLVVAVTVFLSTFTCLIIEVPFQNVGKAWIRLLESRPHRSGTLTTD